MKDVATIRIEPHKVLFNFIEGHHKNIEYLLCVANNHRVTIHGIEDSPDRKDDKDGKGRDQYRQNRTNYEASVSILHYNPKRS